MSLRASPHGWNLRLFYSCSLFFNSQQPNHSYIPKRLLRLQRSLAVDSAGRFVYVKRRPAFQNQHARKPDPVDVNQDGGPFKTRRRAKNTRRGGRTRDGSTLHIRRDQLFHSWTLSCFRCGSRTSRRSWSTDPESTEQPARCPRRLSCPCGDIGVTHIPLPLCTRCQIMRLRNR